MGRGVLPPGTLPGLSPGADGELDGPQTPCLTRNETPPVTALHFKKKFFSYLASKIKRKMERSQSLEIS